MKRTNFIIIIFSIISAISTYLLYDSMEGFKTDMRESKTSVKEMQEQMNTIENKYKTEIQYWAAKNNELNRQIQKTETALSESKGKANSLQGKIQLLISESYRVQDTAQLISDCDSLKEQVQDFIVESNLRDSLCDDEISSLKSVIQNKDSAFAVCERGFSAFHGLVDFSLAQQTALADKLSLAEKQAGREKKKTKFLAGAVCILSGITAALLLAK